VALWGCTATRSISPPAPSPGPPDPCLITTDQPASADTISIALLEPVDRSRVSQPSNDSERLLFRSISHNLVRLDCEGNLRPELAQSWVTDGQHRIWTFTLSDSAVTALGSHTSAGEVADSLRQLWQRVEATGIDSITASGDRQVRVVLGRDTIPTALADPSMALVDSAFQDGTLDAAMFRVPARPSRPALDFWLMPLDPRDALDRGVDLLVTRSAELTDYVRGRPEFTSIPLPWTRTYLLVQPMPAQQLDGTDSLDRETLARDAVHADARPAVIPSWLGEATRCPASPSDSAAVRSNRVAYQLGDDVARGLAERVVALAQPGTPLRSLGLPPSEFSAHLRQRSEAAYVVAVPSRTLVPCSSVILLPGKARVDPLIETRAHAIVRRGAPPLTVDWDGTVRPAAP
jgi:hypothetical protein